MKHIITTALIVIVTIVATAIVMNFRAGQAQEKSKTELPPGPKVIILPVNAKDGHIEMLIYVGSKSYKFSMNSGDTAVIKDYKDEVKIHPRPETAD